jgi:tetratricopeptide (TPR) repeat protein
VTSLPKNRSNSDAAVKTQRAIISILFILGAFSLCASTLPGAQSSTNSAALKKIQILVERNQLDSAERQLWEIVTREPENAPAIHLLGSIRMLQKRLPEAEALFKRSLVLTPDFAVAYRNLGELYVLQQRREEAKSAFLKAHELAPRDFKTNLELGSLYQEAGEFQSSIEIIDAIPSGQRPSAALPILAADYFALKQPEKVAALAPILRRDSAADPSLLPKFVHVLLENGFVDDAEDLLKGAPERQKSTPDYLLVLARAQELLGHLPLAERTLSRATRLHPKSFDAYFQSARVASKQNDFKRESVLLAAALGLRPDDIETLRHIVLSRMRAGIPVQAVTAAQHLYSLQPDDPDAVYLLAASLANHAEWHEARPVGEKLVKLRDDAASHVVFGMVLLNDGDIEGASLQVERALQQNPNETEAHYYKGVIARQHGDLSAAIKEMETVVAANPQHVLAQGELGTLSLQMGNLDGARKAFEQAVSVRPDVPENHYQLALAYSRLGLQDKAREQMAEFQKLRKAADVAKAKGPPAGDAPSENNPMAQPR